MTNLETLTKSTLDRTVRRLEAWHRKDRRRGPWALWLLLSAMAIGTVALAVTDAWDSGDEQGIPQQVISYLSSALLLIGVLVALVLTIAINSVDERPDADPVHRLRAKADAVGTAFKEAERLMVELRGELDAQQATLEDLVRRTSEQQRMLEVDKEQAELVGEILFAATKQSDRLKRHREWAFFAVGLIASGLVGVLINIWV